MKALRLEDLIPEDATFTLRATGKIYCIRKFNLEDETWLKETFGDELGVILQQIRHREIARIVFHQLKEADKKDFAFQKVTFMDEDGRKAEKEVGGYHLLCQMISGNMEKIQIFEALMQAIGISRPIMDDMMKDTSLESQKKSESQRTGGKSSTRSQASTAGRSTRSESLR